MIIQKNTSAKSEESNKEFSEQIDSILEMKFS